MPERVVALNATLGELFGSTLAMPSLVVWPTWFDITVTGPHTGLWGELLFSPHRASRWHAQDDLGRQYIGATTGGSGGLGLHSHHLSFIPTLHAAATALTVTFPSSIDGTTTHATVRLRGPAQQDGAVS